MTAAELMQQLRAMLRKYDTVEVKMIHGQMQLIGIRRKLEEKLTVE